MFIIPVIFFIAAAIFIFTRQPQFGRLPEGKRLERISKSPNYRNGAFQNIHPTPNLTEGASYLAVMYAFFFKGDKRLKPLDVLPSVETDLSKRPPSQDELIWFGHSSYYMQIDGKKILVDPVLSGGASPLPFTTRSFLGADIYKPEDIPAIDILILTHDHWDHLDYKTIISIKERVKWFICGLGVGAHLERWGVDSNKIIEMDWNDSTSLLDGQFTIHATPARHFSGRAFRRNKTLWNSYVLEGPNIKVFIGGDSGYDTHFAEIGEKFGPFDLAVLENGQYNINWRYIHTLPQEIMKAATELKAKSVLPVHSSKFPLANHAWDDPLIRITEESAKHDIRVVTPRIGEVLRLRDFSQKFSRWWEGVQ